ncbi:hypothetical protein GIB67_014997 [Kingdonia uniflora]|uniref:Transposase MuDR plant domain-containing protein n=1 Tax=Kingdonia uniflora TaxID=39325 RepID=A0A7J7MTL0_9MAGN|nr:hypothetical protein GIB67_014997 [Kingdonia uniflora]
MPIKPKMKRVRPSELPEEKLDDLRVIYISDDDDEVQEVKGHAEIPLWEERLQEYSDLLGNYEVCLSGDDMDGDAGDGDASSEAGDGEPIIGDDIHGDDMNGDANNMDGDDIPSVEDFRRCGEFEELIRESENIFQVEKEEAYKKQPQSGYDKLVLGIEGPTIDEARKYLRKFAIINKFCFLYVKNESYRLRFKCEEEEYSWYVYVRKTNDGNTMILRGRNFDHSCSGKLDYGSRLANAQWAANDCEEMVRDVKIVTPADIITRIRRAYGVNISYYIAWNTKTICVERITGCFDEGYSIMQELCRQVLLSNLGSIAKCGCDPHTKMWTGTCITFKASLDGFVSECTEKWTTILEMLAPFLTMHPSKLTFISDRHKGLVESFSQILALPCVHALCVIMEMRMDWVGFCSEYHMVAVYRRSYKGSVLPISDSSLWEKTYKRPPAVLRPRNSQPTTRTDRRGGRPRGSKPRNNPPTRVGVGMRGDGAARVHTQASKKSTNNARGGFARGGAVRVHTQASQQSANSARGGLTRGGAARVHTQASKQSTNNARGLTRGWNIV